MKRAILAVIFVGIFAITSCKKDDKAVNNNIIYQGGSWTFSGLPYTATSCIGSPASALLTASGLSGNGSSDLSMTFNFTDGYPATSGTYTVLNGHNDGSVPLENLVMINAALTGAVNASYYSSGDNGSQTVYVTVANGKISITGSGIQMVNANNAANTTTLSVNITQTQ